MDQPNYPIQLPPPFPPGSRQETLPTPHATAASFGMMTTAPPFPTQQYAATSQHHMPPPLYARPGPPTALPGPPQLSSSHHDGKYRYSLSVEQQPHRARMCGFGDKDRRPITPPPCVRLIITDAQTGREVDISEIDGSFFVLQVDLWSDDARRDVNIVRASSSSPATSISTATTTSFPPTPDRPPFGHVYGGTQVMGQDGRMYHVPYGTNQAYPHASSAYPQPAGFMPPTPAGPNSMMFTRNLIGSLTVNASRLTDLERKVSYWFVLQDLSVRTEGWFRLKMNFINVGNTSGTGLVQGRAPVLAWAFSDKFQVYSAKKFPGVIESTELSKCFAQQGIKIPIRKDTKSPDDKDDEG